MKIINYLPDNILSIYVKNQMEQISHALEALSADWNHSLLIVDILKETKDYLELLAPDNLSVTEEQGQLHQRRIEKYTTWLEVLRLVRYQYGRYADFKESYSEGLYSVLTAMCARYGKKSEKQKIAVIGCGPGRTVADLALLFPETLVTGLDYSLISLIMAKNILLKKDCITRIPIRDVNAANGISSIMSIPSMGLTNVRLGLFDLTVPSQLKFDMIVCSNTINLMPDHKVAVKNITNMLNPGGVIVYADLVGWRIDRPAEQKLLRSMESIISCFESMDCLTLDCFKGGPYIEEETQDNRTIYTEYFYVGGKRD